MVTNRIMLREGHGSDGRALSRRLSELKNQAKNIADWREQARKHPVSMLGLAFGFGCLAATLARTQRREPQRDASSTRYRQSRVASGATELLQDVSRAALGSITARLTSFVDDLMPGFKQELDQQRRDRN